MGWGGVEAHWDSTERTPTAKKLQEADKMSINMWGCSTPFLAKEKGQAT